MESPNKRRALAPLNANALPSPKPVGSFKPSLAASTVVKPDTYGGSPLRKRAVEAATAAAMEPSPKRMCGTEAQQEHKSPSRDTSPDDEEDSSLFDNNDSWTSVTTPGASPAQARMSREQAREKAEILRLKLGLASYKVRTGQTDVPLAELVAKPLPRDASAGRSNTQQQQQQQEKDQENSGGDGGEVLELPLLRRVEEDGAMATPKRQMALRDDERLTSSALRGGAANGLLSLARGALGEQ